MWLVERHTPFMPGFADANPPVPNGILINQERFRAESSAGFYWQCVMGRAELPTMMH